MTEFQRSWPWWRWVLTGLSSLALALSAYLGWRYLVGGSVIGCGVPGSPGCGQVLSSRWSTVWGVLPVSGLAAGVYLATLVASLFIGPATAAPVRRLAWGAMLLLAGAAAGSALWFIILQKWFIGTFCPYCTATHLTGLLLAAVVIWRAPRRPRHLPGGEGRHAKKDQCSGNDLRPREGPIGIRIWAVVGLLLAGILAACQAGFAPTAAYRGGESQKNLPVLDLRAIPLVGSPEALHIVNVLFDYKCPHCQQIHFMLNEAVRRYGGKLAFALCPTPLNRQCNPYIPRDVDEFTDSCELARIGLAVWLANRKAFPAFDDWMFSFESGDRWRPRSVEAARSKAVELVGQAKFDTSQADPWIYRYLQTSIRIYADTIQNGNGAVPKLVFGSRWVIPQPRDADDLVTILQKSLALPRP